VAVALVAGLCSLSSILFACRRSTAAVAMCGIFFCVAASVLVTSFDARNSRAMKSVYVSAGADWISGPATIVLGSAARPDVFQQLFWNRNAKTLALLPGVAVPDTFTARGTGVDQTGRLVGLTGRVVLDESGSAFVPREPLRMAGSWLEARTPALAAELDGRSGDGWLSPSGHVRVFVPGTLSFTITAPEAMTFRIDGRKVRLHTGVPTHVHLCVPGSYGFAFSSHGYLGFRPVSARVTFPQWEPARTCRSGSALETR
jgi:hypothetical protein